MMTLKDIVSFIENVWSKVEAIKILLAVVLMAVGTLGIPRALEYSFFSNSSDLVFFTFNQESSLNQTIKGHNDIKQLIDDDLRAKTRNNPAEYEMYKRYDEAYEAGAKRSATPEEIHDAKVIAVNNDGDSDLANLVIDLEGCSKYKLFRISPPLKTGDEYDKINKSINVDEKWKSIRLTLPLLKQVESATVTIYAEDALSCTAQVSAERVLDKKTIKGRLINSEDYRLEKQLQQKQFYRLAIYAIFTFITILSAFGYLFFQKLSNRINNLEKSHRE